MAEELHYHGHRERLRRRFAKSGAEALGDHELLELPPFGARPRGDTKPLAKRLPPGSAASVPCRAPTGRP